MMQGRLIIGSKIGGLAEEVGEAGLTFPAGNASALADQMQRVTKEPELIATMGKQALDRARKFYTLEHMIMEYRDLLSPAKQT